MKFFLVLLFVISAALAGKEVPIVSRSSRSSGALEEPSVSEIAANTVAVKVAAKKPAAKKTAAKKTAAKKPAKKTAPKRKKSVEEVEFKKIGEQIKRSVKRISEEHKKRKRKMSPFHVGCYSALASHIFTLCLIILIAIVWYFGCIRHGRCCCLCCYNKAGRCCCACSCCDGYIEQEDEQMVISRGNDHDPAPNYESVEKTA